MLEKAGQETKFSLPMNSSNSPYLGKEKGALDNVSLITMRYKRGVHTGVYEDFEADILKYTGWKDVKGSLNIYERLFEKFLLPKLKYRTFSLDLPTLDRAKILFSCLSGIEYIKILQNYLFKSRLKVIYQFDTWSHDNAINENAFRSFRINLAFLSIKKAAEYFNSLNIPDFRAYWMPEAVNSEKCFYSDYSAKDVDILQYGRRWEWLHERLLHFCPYRNINYRYSIEKGNSQRQFNTREELLAALAKTKIAVCVPKTVTNPDKYDLETVTTRYFECMASKCLVIGHAPQDLCDLFGYNPVIEIDPETPEQQISCILDNYNDYRELIERNCDLVREKHQWKNRIASMVEIMQAYLEPEG